MMNYAIALLLLNVSVLAGWSSFTGENGFAELGKFFRGEPAFIVTPKLSAADAAGAGLGGNFTEGPVKSPGQVGGGGGGGAW